MDKESIFKQLNTIRSTIKEKGHAICGVVDGKGHLERPFVYSIGVSPSLGVEFICFFPIKGKGLPIISGIINRIVKSIKKKEINLTHQIINNDTIYQLPIAMLLLDEDIKKDIESIWARQLERNGSLAEYSTDEHKLVLLICTDKNGVFPWEKNCEGYWNQMCPPPFAAIAEMEIVCNDSLLKTLEKKYKK